VSSKASSQPAGGVSPYAFPQFDSPVTVSEIGDALAAAQREAEHLREQGRSQGYAEGHAAGLAEAREQALPAVAAIAQTGAEFAALRDELIAGLEQDAIAFALDLTEHILAGALAVEPERVLDVARHTLRRVSDRRHVTLIVNPEDLAMLTEAVPELLAELGGIDHLAVQSDRRVGRGGSIARTEAGEVDAGIAVQLAHARELVATTLADELPDAGTLNAALSPGPPAVTEPNDEF
jgi:flagellar assembly protein FliH